MKTKKEKELETTIRQLRTTIMKDGGIAPDKIKSTLDIIDEGDEKMDKPKTLTAEEARKLALEIAEKHERDWKEYAEKDCKAIYCDKDCDENCNSAKLSAYKYKMADKIRLWFKRYVELGWTADSNSAEALIKFLLEE